MRPALTVASNVGLLCLFPASSCNGSNVFVFNSNKYSKKGLLTSKGEALASVTLNTSAWPLRAWLLGFPTMLLATGRRPPSMSKGGMWPQCGSDRRDGGRESRTREHGQGKAGQKGLNRGQQIFS